MRPHRCIFIFLLYPVLTAQVPFEYFNLKTIEPPKATGAFSQPTVQSALPTHLSLDAQTQAAGDLTMTEPFAPPVGTYKRRMVFSHITDATDGTHHQFILSPSQEPCQRYDFPKPSSEHALHRSALLYIQPDETHLCDLPSDSADMRVIRLHAHETISGKATHDLEILECPNQILMIRAPDTKRYTIEYETASYHDGSIPKSAEFFETLQATSPDLLTPTQQAMMRQIIARVPALTDLNARRNIAELIQYFQSFTSESIDNFDLQMPFGDDLLYAILQQKKGLCRHRTFAFMLVASYWGYPTRIVVNEVHAFIEIALGQRWYPVELGGRARSLSSISTSPNMPKTIQSDFSFLPFLPTTSAHSSTHAIDTPTHRRQDAASSNVIFDAFEPLPETIRRGSAIRFFGRLRDATMRPIRKGKFLLTIQNERENRRASHTVESDHNGYIDVTIKLDDDWPIGATQTTWQRKEE